MSSAQLRQLIGGFLALAALAGILSFLAARVAPNSPPTTKAPAESSLPANAFVEEPAEQLVQAGSINLTQTLTRSVARDILDANPEGPQAEAGAYAAIVPEIELFADSFYGQPAVSGDIYLIAAVEAAPPVIDASAIKTSSRSGATEKRRYLEEINAVLAAGILSPDSLYVLRNKNSPEAMNSVQSAFDLTLTEFAAVTVPKDVLPLHLSILRMLTHERNMVGTGLVFPQDPLRAVLVYELQDKNLDQLVAEYRRETEAAGDLLASADFDPSLRATGLSLFALPTAHAQWAVFDPANLAEMIREFAWKAWVESMKDQLIHRMVQQVVTWIQGGGQPQFITNWKGFLRDASNLAAGSVIEKIAPQLCQSFGPLVRISLLPVNLPSYPVTCTLDQVVANVQDFYNDFNQGGWIAYGAALQPQNNYLGALIQVSDIADREAAKAQAAAQAEAQAGQGFQSTKDCVKRITVVPYDQCIQENGGNAAACVHLLGVPAYTNCEEHKVTTPGATIESITGQTLLAPLHRIVNADDMAALFSALLNSVLNKLLTIGSKGLAGLSAAGPTGQPYPDPCADVCDTPGSNARTRCEATACNGLPSDLLALCQQALAAGRQACVPPPPPPPPSGGGSCSYLLASRGTAKQSVVKTAMDAVLPAWANSTDVDGFKMDVVAWLNANGEVAARGWNGNCNASANNLAIQTNSVNGVMMGEMYEIARDNAGCQDEPNPTLAESTPCRPLEAYVGPWSYMSTGVQPAGGSGGGGGTPPPGTGGSGGGTPFPPFGGPSPTSGRFLPGQSGFLVFAGYFDALDAQDLTGDLDYLNSKGIDGIRIFPNWWDQCCSPTVAGYTLMNQDGSLDTNRLADLQRVVREAANRGLLVDVSFARETVAGPCAGSMCESEYKNGVVATVRALTQAGLSNVIYDLQNEFDGGSTNLSSGHMQDLLRRVRQANPTAILSGSSGSQGASGGDAANLTRQYGFDITNVHSTQLTSANAVQGIIASALSAGKPVYLGEPYHTNTLSSLSGTELVRFATEAKKGGAAAFVFHSDASFDLDNSTLQNNYGQIEKDFLNQFLAPVQSAYRGAPGRLSSASPLSFLAALRTGLAAIFSGDEKLRMVYN